MDLGFTTKEQRKHFSGLAEDLNIDPEIDCLDASKDIRKKRIKRRNIEKDPSVFSFEVNDMMFNFMKPKFEVPDQKELKSGCKVNT